MDTRTIVLAVFRDLEINTTGIDETTRLREDLDVDSTELIEIAVAIERSIPRKVDTDDFLAVKTFGELVGYVDNAEPRG